MVRLTISEHEGRLLNKKAMLAHNMKQLSKLKKETEDLLAYVNDYEKQIEQAKRDGLKDFKI